MKMKEAIFLAWSLVVSAGFAGTITAAPNEGGRRETTGEPVIELAPQWQAMVDGDGRFDTFQGRDLPVSAETAVLSPDETRIAATAKGDGAIVMLDARDGREIWRRDGEAETECAAFTPDGRYLITGGEADPQVRVWRVADGLFVRGWRGRRSVEGMKFSPDGAWLATGDEAGQIHVYDTRAADPVDWPATAPHVLTQGPDVDLTGMAQDGHADVNQVDWSADGARLYTGGRNGVVKLWRRVDFGTGDATRVYKGNEGSIKGVRLSPRGDLVAAVSGALGPDVPSRVVVWREADGGC